LLQEKLFKDYAYANELEIENRVVTGRVRGEIIDGARKALLLNDLPTLSIAGLGSAFHARPIVGASAQHSLDTLGLDGTLYLMGLKEWETM